MTNQNELLSLIEKQIESINRYVATISFENIDEVTKNKNLIEQNFSLNSFDFLNELSLDKLRMILPKTFENDLANLSFYISILKTSYANHLKEQPQVLAQIKEILSKIHANLTKLVGKQTQDKMRVISYGKTKTRLEKLKNKIKSNEDYFDDEEIESVYSVLNSLEDKDKAMELLIAFGEELLKPKNNKTMEIEEEQLIENENTDLIQEKLVSIFSKFGLDFNAFYHKLSNNEQIEFIKYVRPDKVESILNTLKEFNISLNDSYYNSRLLLGKAKQIKELLMYSSSEILKRILTIANDEQIYNNVIEEINGNVKKGIDFDLLLESPARFIDRKRRYKIKGNEKIDVRFGEDNIGAANDFIDNMELFKSYGVAPTKFCENAKVSILSTEKIKKIISIFELYGISKEFFTKTLSCFDSIHQADSLDQFIELGQFDYVLKNMSRCQLLPNNLIFYRLVYGFKHTNIPIESMITKKGNFSSLITDTSKKSEATFGINAYNKQNKVNQTASFYGDKELCHTYDELVNPLSSEIAISSSRTGIIPLLDEYFLVRKTDGEMIYPNIYNFGTVDTIRGKWNIIISRNKVLRICNELMQHNVDINDMDTIMYIVTKNSILTQEEYNIIYNQISNARKRGAIK